MAPPKSDVTKMGALHFFRIFYKLVKPMDAYCKYPHDNATVRASCTYTRPSSAATSTVLPNWSGCLDRYTKSNSVTALGSLL